MARIRQMRLDELLEFGFGFQGGQAAAAQLRRDE